ncbi:hypothetical protein C0991_000192 [Blastosporella zonata]|nr:hypothetical protein C0991_000192 [Blastosporella zonata]
MANDPGRDILQGQLNAHGFIFLDDYLDNIVSGPSRHPIIELVKTPGRKKMSSKKPKAPSSSKLRMATSLQNEEEIKENTAPLNTFHKALLKAKAQTIPAAANFSLSPQHQQVTDSIFDTSLAASADNAFSNRIVDLNGGFLAPGRLDQNDLSVIAEDDEHPESNTLSRKNSDIPVSQLPHLQIADETYSHAGIIVDPPIAESSSDVFHSITLDSPLHNVHKNSPTMASPPMAPTLSVVDEVKPIDKSARSDSPIVLPTPLSIDTDDTSKAISMDTHVVESNSHTGRDFEMPLRDHDQVISGDKVAVALFPSLPAPMPLRKSVRMPRDPSVGTCLTGVATPSAPPGGKRTSWLKKAREVKALEVTIKSSNAPLPPPQAHPSHNVMKRKSGDLLTSTDLEDQERHAKSSKINVHDEAPLKATPETHEILELRPPLPLPHTVTDAPGHEGMLDRFKRTVEDLGARVGKSMGKSIGAAAAATSALAEARAAAEARVAERHNKEEELTRISGPGTVPLLTLDNSSTNSTMNGTFGISALEERRLSISDLFPPMNSIIKIKDKSTSPELRQKAIPSPATRDQQYNRESTTTTPPDSPPTSPSTSFFLPSGPVFNKPPPVFVAPVPTSKPFQHDNPPISAFPPPMSLGIGPRLPSPSSSKYTSPLSKQSTMESIQSTLLFDGADVPAWVPDTQDTDYSSRYDSQSQHAYQNPTDEDDSWPIDEKLASGVQWTFGGNIKEDSMTWSTLPSQSHRGDTIASHSQKHEESAIPQEPQRDVPYSLSKAIPGAFDMDMGEGDEGDFAQGDSELEDIVLDRKPTSSLMETVSRSEGQPSLMSSQSSQSHTGFLGQASRIIGSALGASKKGNDVKKVLQMAAAAAKKQQEENDKKAARLKDMENRRHLAMQRKAEEEKARTLEQEGKVKEEGERRKREREENTDKRTLKPGGKKDEDVTKKRKFVTTDGEKRELKKPLPKPIMKSSLKPHSALSSSAAYNTSHHSAATSSFSSDSKAFKPPPAAVTLQKGKGKVQNTPIPDDDLSQPSQLVQIQMAARAKAQIQAAHLASEPLVASESIDLPEINSEYSDSDDEDRPKSFPGWAQSPELRQALQLQSTINPDDIFGAIRPLRMEELFKTRTSRFRARTSSANWTGADRLTMEEEREYAKKMGFK